MAWFKKLAGFAAQDNGLDADSGYTGLTTDGSGFITVGLGLGSGLGAYASSLQVSGQDIYLNVSPVPEPSTFAMLGCGLWALAIALRFRRNR